MITTKYMHNNNNSASNGLEKIAFDAIMADMLQVCIAITTLLFATWIVWLLAMQRPICIIKL